MAAVTLSAGEVSSFLTDGVVIACDNSPNSTTLSGERSRLDEVLSSIKKQKPDTMVRKLRVDMAYHSGEYTTQGNRVLLTSKSQRT